MKQDKMKEDMQNTARPALKINPPVFISTLLFTLAFIGFGTGFSRQAQQLFSTMQDWIAQTFDWFYLLAVAGFVIFTVALALSSYGRVKLGPKHAAPEFSYSAWFAMLFSAGMGIGLMFFGVAEPIMHFIAPPLGEPESIAAAREAMKITFFHWGMHAWSIYAVVALSLAYFSFRHDLPLTLRSAFYPLIGERIYGPIGHSIDILAVIGTLFGIATSLGLGVMQINAGLHHLFDVPVSMGVQLVLIAVVTAIATISVGAGLDAGIRRLSQFNVAMAILLMLFVLLAGPTLHLLQTLVQNTGAYLSDLVYRTFNLYAYQADTAFSDWIGGWTIFYWAWWIAWSPFVGMFIARISRGRTIREFVGGVLLVPSGFALMWFTFFGNTAIDLILHKNLVVLSEVVQDDLPLALFVFLEQLPWAGISTLLATVLVVTFFVTSSDSGALVLDIITSGGAQDTPVWQRIFWAIACGAVAAVLLVAGGLEALQAAALAGALPLTFVLIFSCWGLMKALRIDRIKHIGLQAYISSGAGPYRHTPWQRRIRQALSFPSHAEANRFLQQVVLPALHEVAAEFRRRGLEEATVQDEEDRATLSLPHGDAPEFSYQVRLRSYTVPTFAFSEVRSSNQSARQRTYYRAEVFLHEGGQDYDLIGLSQEQVIADVLAQYDQHLHFLHLTRELGNY